MKRYSLIIVIAAFILASCGTRASSTAAPPNNSIPSSGGAPVERFAAEAPAPAATAGAPSVSDQTNLDASNANAAATERLVIQNADLAIVVPDVEKRAKDIEAMAVQMGGYVVSSNHYQTYASNNTQVPEADLVIRIPAEKLNDALDQIKKDVVEVQSENRSGQDVTNQYVDLQSQLKAKEAAQDQLLKIMQNADKTEDVLAVYQQLQTIQTDIEVLKGQIKYYEESAALSAITVRIIAEETIQPIEVAGWKPQGVARDAIQGLIRFLQGFVDFMIVFFLRDLWEILLVALPFYVLFLIGRAIFRKVRGNKKKEQTPPLAEK